MEDNLETQKFNVSKVILHEHPDIDAIFAYWLAKSNPEVFVGIFDADIEFWPQSSPQDIRAPEYLEAEGIICFDVGEGRFDHHPHGKYPTLCASDLVAEFLGISGDIALRQMLDYVRLHDLEGCNTSRHLREAGVDEDLVHKTNLMEVFSLAIILGQMRKVYRNNHRLIDWACKIFDLYYEQQVRFWTETKDEFFNRADIRMISDGERNYKVALITSNLRSVGSFSRTRDGGFCSICIHRDSDSQHTFVSGTVSSAQFAEIAKFLRIAELQKRGITKNYQLSALTDSKFDLNHVWYLPKDINGDIFIIMNGGEKAIEVEPSLLNMDEMFACVLLGLDEAVLAPECPKEYCLFQQCCLYKYGLARCQEIRS